MLKLLAGLGTIEFVRQFRSSLAGLDFHLKMFVVQLQADEVTMV